MKAPWPALSANRDFLKFFIVNTQNVQSHSISSEFVEACYALWSQGGRAYSYESKDAKIGFYQVCFASS